jgi:hypothetical protein
VNHATITTTGNGPDAIEGAARGVDIGGNDYDPTQETATNWWTLVAVCGATFMLLAAAAQLRGLPAQGQITHLATIAFVSGTNWLLLVSAATVTAGALCAFCFVRSADLVHATAPRQSAAATEAV